MYDLRSVKPKRCYNSVTKSNTAVTLPGINKTIVYSETERQKNKSTYLDTIAHLSSNVEYEKKDMFYVNKQQNTLKTILKKMNKDTMELVDHLRPRKSPRTIDIEHQALTAEKEVQNSRKMIRILKHEIDQLKEKHSRIVQHQEYPQLIRKISQTKKEIEKIKQINVQEKLNVSKDGKDLLNTSDLQDQKIMMLETDHQLTSNRLSKLQADSARVNEQSKKLISKLAEVDPAIQLLQTDYAKVLETRNEENACKARQREFKSKKIKLDSVKRKIDSINSFNQIRYYKLLKDLEAETEVCSLINDKTGQLESRSKYIIKQELTKLQAEFTELKKQKKEKNRTVKEYLDTQRKSRILENSRISQDFLSEEMKPQIVKTDSELIQYSADKVRKTESAMQNPIKEEEHEERKWTAQVKPAQEGEREHSLVKIDLTTKHDLEKSVQNVDQQSYPVQPPEIVAAQAVDQTSKVEK